VRSYDAVVIGAGIVGSSVALGLARTGLSRVLVCEQGQPPGLGATAYSGAILREHHTCGCDTALAVRGVRFFREWGQEVGGDCGYRQTGFAVLVGPEFLDHLTKNVAAVNDAGGTSVILSAGELAALHPGLLVPPDVLVGYEPYGGYVDPSLATTSLLRAASRHGATVFEGVRVTGVLIVGEHVVGVDTSVGAISSEVVVLCGGAWTKLLLDGLSIDLPLQPRRIGIARALTGLAPRALPACIDDTLGTYFRPVDDGSVFFGVRLDPWSDCPAAPAPVDPIEAGVAARRLAVRIPALDAASLDGNRVGVDAYTPDNRPAIGWMARAGLYVCTGFSGGGIKVAPAVGDLVAQEIVHGCRRDLLEAYRPGRFSTCDLIESEFPYAHM
jgi:sarcosine oxidase subunit beta